MAISRGGSGISTREGPLVNNCARKVSTTPTSLPRTAGEPHETRFFNRFFYHICAAQIHSKPKLFWLKGVAKLAVQLQPSVH